MVTSSKLDVFIVRQNKKNLKKSETKLPSHGMSLLRIWMSIMKKNFLPPPATKISSTENTFILKHQNIKTTLRSLIYLRNKHWGFAHPLSPIYNHTEYLE